MPGRIVINPMLYYIDGRLFEWTMTVGTVLLGFQLTILPKSMTEAPFVWLMEITSTTFLSVLMIIVGFTRLGALIANGASLVIGPYLRSLMALISSALWFEFGFSFFLGALQRGYGGPLVFWFLFTLAELYVVYRAVLDVRISR